MGKEKIQRQNLITFTAVIVGALFIILVTNDVLRYDISQFIFRPRDTILSIFPNLERAVNRRDARNQLRELNIENSEESFIVSAGSGNLMAVQLFLEAGIDIHVVHQSDGTKFSGMTALMAAVFQGHTQVVEILLKEGASAKRSRQTEALSDLRLLYAGFDDADQSGAGKAVIRDEEIIDISDIPSLDGISSQDLSIDGLFLAYDSCSNRNLRRGIYVSRANGEHPRLIKPLEGEFCTTVRWLPDDTKLSYENLEDRFIYIIDIATGEETLMSNARNAGFYWWSPDGSQLVHAEFSSDPEVFRSLHITSFDGRSYQLSFPGKFEPCAREDGNFEFDFWDPAWSPDGNLIAFTHCKNLYTISPDGENLQQLTSTSAYSPRWSPDGQFIFFLDKDELKRVSRDGLDLKKIGEIQYYRAPFSVSLIPE